MVTEALTGRMQQPGAQGRVRAHDTSFCFGLVASIIPKQSNSGFLSCRHWSPAGHIFARIVFLTRETLDGTADNTRNRYLKIAKILSHSSLR